MKKIKILLSLFLLTAVAAPMLWAAYEDLQINRLTDDRIRYYPIPSDNKNYFFLHSFEKRTNIIIGDFSGLKKMVVMIVDDNSDNKIDRVVEYFPETGKTRISKSSSSKFFSTDIAALKKQIIEGSLFKRENYTDQMKSVDICKAIIKEGDKRYITRDTYGYTVKFHEVDNLDKYSAMFSFGKNSDGYYLSFRTDYYRKAYNETEKPILRYSVYCKKSMDPVVMSTVDELLKVKSL